MKNWHDCMLVSFFQIGYIGIRLSWRRNFYFLKWVLTRSGSGSERHKQSFEYGGHAAYNLRLSMYQKILDFGWNLNQIKVGRAIHSNCLVRSVSWVSLIASELFKLPFTGYAGTTGLQHYKVFHIIVFKLAKFWLISSHIIVKYAAFI